MLNNLDIFVKPIIYKTVNKIIDYALQLEASSLQLWLNTENRLQITYKANGSILEDITIEPHLAKDVWKKIASSAGLKRNQEEGAWETERHGGLVKMNVFLIKTSRGEILNLEIKSPTQEIFCLNELGLTQEQLQPLTSALYQKGLIILSSPKRQGKTTTALSCLLEFSLSKHNAYFLSNDQCLDIDGLNQVKIKKNTATLWDAMIRSVAKQDPDIVCLDEPTEGFNAEIIASLALNKTVILTMCSDNIYETARKINQLKLFSGVSWPKINLITNQRLIRKLCPDCSLSYPLNEDLYTEIANQFEILDRDLIGLDLYHSAGCQACNHTGHIGQTGLFELCQTDAEINKVFSGIEKTSKLNSLIDKNTQLTLVENGFVKALNGQTSIEELKRII